MFLSIHSALGLQGGALVPTLGGGGDRDRTLTVPDSPRFASLTCPWHNALAPASIKRVFAAKTKRQKKKKSLLHRLELEGLQAFPCFSEPIVNAELKY